MSCPATTRTATRNKPELNREVFLSSVLTPPSHGPNKSHALTKQTFKVVQKLSVRCCKAMPSATEAPWWMTEVFQVLQGFYDFFGSFAFKLSCYFKNCTIASTKPCCVIGNEVSVQAHFSHLCSVSWGTGLDVGLK